MVIEEYICRGIVYRKKQWEVSCERGSVYYQTRSFCTGTGGFQINILVRWDKTPLCKECIATIATKASYLDAGTSIRLCVDSLVAKSFTSQGVKCEFQLNIMVHLQALCKGM